MYLCILFPADIQQKEWGHSLDEEDEPTDIKEEEEELWTSEEEEPFQGVEDLCAILTCTSRIVHCTAISIYSRTIDAFSNIHH